MKTWERGNVGTGGAGDRRVDLASTISPRDRALGIAALVLTAALWSLNGPLIKLLNRDAPDAAGLPGVSIACWRSLVGGLFFLPFALRSFGTIRRVSWAWRLGSVATFTLMTASFVIATTQTAAANAIILQYTAPIWVFLLSPLLLRVTPRPADGLWLLIAMAGVGLILSQQWESDLAGLLIALDSGLGYGALIVVLRGLRAVDPTVVVAVNLLGSGLILLPWALAAGMSLTAAQLVLVLMLGIVQLALPYVIFSWALRRIHAHHAALIVLLEAILNPLLTWLVVGEPIPPATLLGGPLILAGAAGWLAAGGEKVKR